MEHTETGPSKSVKGSSLPALRAALHVPRERLRAEQQARLATLLATTIEHNPFYGSKLADIDHGSRPPLEQLPFTTRGELQDDQLAHPPYGTNLTFPLCDYNRLHQTSGTSGVPLRWLDTPASWRWWKTCWQSVYAAAGITAADRLVFTFSFGPFVGFWSAFEAATDLGNLCLAAGGMSTTARLHYILDHGATVLCCTPTYALRLAQVAQEDKLDLPRSTVRAIIVAGEPGGNVAATRQQIESDWGARVYDHAGMTEIGAWGFEPVDGPGGLHVLENHFIAEVIDPDTERPTGDGEVGEMILTNLGRVGSPLIRYRTGDLVRPVAHQVPGTSFLRLEGGILGRRDDMLIIRGNNVFPSAVEELVRRFPEIVEFRLSVSGRGPMSELVIEIEPAAGVSAEGLEARLGVMIQDHLHFSAVVESVPTGSLPRFEMKARRVRRVDE